MIKKTKLHGFFKKKDIFEINHIQKLLLS